MSLHLGDAVHEDYQGNSLLRSAANRLGKHNNSFAFPTVSRYFTNEQG
jgi:hypothetical protein